MYSTTPSLIRTLANLSRPQKFPKILESGDFFQDFLRRMPQSVYGLRRDAVGLPKQKHRMQKVKQVDVPLRIKDKRRKSPKHEFAVICLNDFNLILI